MGPEHWYMNSISYILGKKPYYVNCKFHRVKNTKMGENILKKVSGMITIQQNYCHMTPYQAELNVVNELKRADKR